MKTFSKLFAAGFLLAGHLLKTSLWADELFVDENGNGYTVSGTTYIGFTTNHFPGSLTTDPSGGLSGSLVLVYDLGFPGPYGRTSGDVALVDVSQGGAVSHIIRFYTTFTMESYLIFYAKDGSGSLADKGLPNSTNTVQIENHGPAGTYWDPNGGQPGFVGGTYPVGTPIGYTFYSQFPAVTNPPAPPISTNALSIAGSTNGIMLSWPTALINYSLFWNSDLAGTNWLAVTNTPITNYGLSQISLQATSTFQIFQLQTNR
jgi:hypothetical protein